MTIGTVELIQGLLIAFLLVVVLMPPYIRFARHFRFGKHIRVEGPESHYLKEGTPTGAGILIVLVVAAVAVLLGAVGSDTPDTYSPLAALLGVAALGAFDDYLNVRTGDGIKARHKLIWLIVVAWPLWSSGQMDAGTAQTANECLLVAIFLVLIPWPYVLATYVMAPGDRWR